MQAIILAAGLSTRMHPLTLTRPKPLLYVANKYLIQHTLDNLDGFVDEAVIVVGYFGEQIKKVLGDSYKSIKLAYVEQKTQLGAGHAIVLAKDFIKDKFFLMPSDDIYSKNDIEKCLNYENALLVSESENPERFGVVKVKNSSIETIIEKPKNPETNKVSTMCFLFQKKIFDFFPESLDFTEAVNSYAKINDIKIIDSTIWLPVGYLWDLLTANEHFLSKMEGNNYFKNMQNYAGICDIKKANLKIGEESLVKSSTMEGNVIIGKNCVIGPYAYIRGPVSIGDNCRIGHSVEIKNSIIMSNTNVAHRSGVLDSIVGENCNFGAGTECANLRHDKKPVLAEINNSLISTGREKFGFVMADNVKTGIGTLISPGRMFWPNTKTIEGEIVRRNKK